MTKPIAALMIVALAAHLEAQKPTVFVHGFASRGGTWETAMNTLASDGTITPFSPNLSWFKYYKVQAYELADAGRGGGWWHTPDLVAVGHSNGGQVIRASLLYGDATYPGGIVAVTSPLQGAKLAESFTDGLVTGYIAQWYYGWRLPFEYYPRWGDFWWYFGWYSAGMLETLMTNRHAYVGATLAAVYDFGALENSVLRDMKPNSTFFREVNAVHNLAEEDRKVPRRLAISSMIDPAITSMYAGLAADNMGQLDNAESMLKATALSAFFYYSFAFHPSHDPDSWNLKENAWMWAVTVGELGFTDPVWCSLLGGVVGSWRDGHCESDGIVSLESQRWPGNVEQTELRYFGPAHTQATSDPSVINRIRLFIQQPQ